MRSLGALIFVSYTRFVPKAVGTSLYDDPKQGPLGSTSSVSGAEGEAAWPLVDQTLGDTDPNDPQKLWGTDASAFMLDITYLHLRCCVTFWNS